MARANVNSDHNKVNLAWRLVSAVRQQPPVLVSITINTRYGYSASAQRNSFNTTQGMVFTILVTKKRPMDISRMRSDYILSYFVCV